MNEQWNNALDQVEDEFLMEAARYRRRRRWPGVVAAAAAVLVLVVGWSVWKPQTPVTPGLDDSTTGLMPSTSPSEPVESDKGQDGVVEGIPPGDHFYGNSTAGSAAPEQTPDIIETLHFDTYQDLRNACLAQNSWYLHQDIMIPCQDGQPMAVQSITAFESEMYHEPWVWYFLSQEPHLTVRIHTRSDLTADLDPDTSGAEALKLIWPDAPNLHNQEDYADRYLQITEITITTSEGEKTALLRQELDRDRAYLTFLQNGTLVTIAGPREVFDGSWLETFALVPIS